MLSLDVYEIWSNLVKKHTVDEACNFQAAACELANLVAAAEREACLSLVVKYRKGYLITAAIRERNNT
jgi:hypothetical protein